MKSLLSIEDLSEKDIRRLLATASKVKAKPASYKKVLEGKKIGLIFEKPSTRTWVSFDAGIFSMGGGSIYLGPDDIKLGVREEIRDVARVLDRYLAGVVLRTFDHKTIEEFKKYFKGPVINGLSDQGHPCQSLADFLTIFEKHKKKAAPVVAFVGDGNNVLNSLLMTAAKLGVDFKYATPKAHGPSKKVVSKVKSWAKRSKAKIEGFEDPKEAVKGVDFIYTDVWVSMGQEKIGKQKARAFKNMQINAALLKRANKSAKVMHCLPAHRGEEITNQVIEGKQSIVFDQAENRLHMQKAILIDLFSKKG